MSKKKKTETPVVVENPDNLPSALFDDAKIDIKGLIHIITISFTIFAQHLT